MSTREQSLEFPLRKADLPWRRLADDRGMLLDLDSGNYYELSGAGPFVWACLDGDTRIDDVARRTAVAYGLNEEPVLLDVRSFVESLHGAGLLDAAADAERPEPIRAWMGAAPERPYAPPALAEKGNLKYLGQLD